MLELVDNYCADDDGAFNNLLPVSGDVGQIEDVIQYLNNERTHDGTGHSADTACRKGCSSDDGIELITSSLFGLTGADSRRYNEPGSSCPQGPGINVHPHLVLPYIQ